MRTLFKYFPHCKLPLWRALSLSSGNATFMSGCSIKQWAENYFGLIYHLFARPTIKLWELSLSIFLIANCLYEERRLCLVATPRSCQGVPRNTLTWRKKNLYIIIKIFYICLPSKKILGIPSIKIRNTLKKISSKHTRKKKGPKKFWTKNLKK